MDETILFDLFSCMSLCIKNTMLLIRGCFASFRNIRTTGQFLCFRNIKTGGQFARFRNIRTRCLFQVSEARKCENMQSFTFPKLENWESVRLFPKHKNMGSVLMFPKHKNGSVSCFRNKKQWKNTQFHVSETWELGVSSYVSETWELGVSSYVSET